MATKGTIPKDSYIYTIVSIKDEYTDDLTSDNADEDESVDENYKAITDQALGIQSSKH